MLGINPRSFTSKLTFSCSAWDSNLGPRALWLSHWSIRIRWQGSNSSSVYSWMSSFLSSSDLGHPHNSIPRWAASWRPTCRSAAVGYEMDAVLASWMRPGPRQPQNRPSWTPLLPPLQRLSRRSAHRGSLTRGAIFLARTTLVLSFSCTPLLFSSPSLPFLLPSQVALEHFSSATDQTPEAVLSVMDRERRYRRPPDPSRLQLEPSSGMYYDPDTRLYYDPRSQYHYDGESGQYVYWSEEAKCYVSAQHMYAAGPNYFQVRSKRGRKKTAQKLFTGFFLHLNQNNENKNIFKH